MLVNLNEVLTDARLKRYAVGLFNATDSDMLQEVEYGSRRTSPTVHGTR